MISFDENGLASDSENTMFLRAYQALDVVKNNNCKQEITNIIDKSVSKLRELESKEDRTTDDNKSIDYHMKTINDFSNILREMNKK